MVKSLFVTAVAVLAASAAAQNTNLQSTFPKPSGTTNLPAVRTVAAGQNFDGGMKVSFLTASTVLSHAC